MSVCGVPHGARLQDRLPGSSPRSSTISCARSPAGLYPVPHDRRHDPAPAPDDAVGQHRPGRLLGRPWRMGCYAAVLGTSGLPGAVSFCVLRYLACCARLPDGCSRGISIGRCAGLFMVSDDSARCCPGPDGASRDPVARSSRATALDAACDVHAAPTRRDAGRSRSQPRDRPHSEGVPGLDPASLIGWAARRAVSARAARVNLVRVERPPDESQGRALGRLADRPPGSEVPSLAQQGLSWGSPRPGLGLGR
jgi:hypothetical protein